MPVPFWSPEALHGHRAGGGVTEPLMGAGMIKVGALTDLGAHVVNLWRCLSGFHTRAPTLAACCPLKHRGLRRRPTRGLASTSSHLVSECSPCLRMVLGNFSRPADSRACRRMHLELQLRAHAGYMCWRLRGRPGNDSLPAAPL